MDRLDQLKGKYASVLDVVKKSNVRLDNLHVQDDKLFLKGAAPTEAIKNKVWDEIKRVDPSLSDLMADIRIDSSIPAPTEAAVAQTYAVQPGDTLSKIAKQYYGDANKYMKIFEANRDQLSDPDKIKAGQTLKIPA
jgi:nucleoid-associated protein YgaU